MSGPAKAGVRCIIARCLVLGLLGVPLVLALASGSASDAAPEVYAELRFSDHPKIDGELEGEGKGEVQIFSGPGLEIEGEGAKLVVEEYRRELLLVDPPVIPPNEFENEDYNKTIFTFHKAHFRLTSVEEGFKSLLMATEDEDGLEFSSGPVESPLVPVKDPALVVDERWEHNQDAGDRPAYFTYVVDGDRFPFPVDTARATGAPVLYLWDAQFEVETQQSRETFTGGSSQEEVAPGAYRYFEVYHLLRLEDGVFDAVGDQVAWIQEPTVDLEGELSSQEAEGLLLYKGDEHRLDGVPVTAQGAIRLEPVPDGDPVSEEKSIGFSSSYNGIYSSSRAKMGGDASLSVSVAGAPVDTPGRDLTPVVATVGIIGLLGAAATLTPQGQWALVGALAPLYAKTQRDRLLESPQRERLMDAIQANPGVHISRLRGIADLSWGTTVYHLRLMEKNGLVTSVPRAGQRHFFIKTPGVDAARLRSAVSAIVGQETAHRVAFAVLNLPGESQKGLAEHLGVSSRVVAHHIARLVKAGLVTKKRDGGFIRCHPTSELGDALAILDTGEVASMAVSSPQEAQVPVVQA